MGPTLLVIASRFRPVRRRPVPTLAHCAWPHVDRQRASTQPLRSLCRRAPGEQVSSLAGVPPRGVRGVLLSRISSPKRCV